MRKLFTLSVLFWLSASHAMADEVAKKYVPNAKKVGMGRLSVVFWDVYDATLYAPSGRWDARKPYALSIDYFREIEGADIADRSAEEMRKQGYSDDAKLAKWEAQMRDMFPNVKNGSKLTAVFTSQKHTVFYSHETRIGTIEDADFGTQFFNIWLSEKTSEPKLRKQLLGML